MIAKRGDVKTKGRSFYNRCVFFFAGKTHWNSGLCGLGVWAICSSESPNQQQPRNLKAYQPFVLGVSPFRETRSYTWLKLNPLGKLLTRCSLTFSMMVTPQHWTDVAVPDLGKHQPGLAAETPPLPWLVMVNDSYDSLWFVDDKHPYLTMIIIDPK